MAIRVVAVVGPTASGKTGLGIRLAQALRGEVVSCDSMQIYKGMDIATAKPTLFEQKGIPHHLIGFVENEESYSVVRYIEDAAAVIDDIVARGKLPIMVGGTGLYVSSLLDGVRFAEQPSDPTVREELYRQADQLGKEQMHRCLTEVDPAYAATLHPNNLGRVLRALELFTLTGKRMSEHLAESRQVPSRYTPVMLGINYRNRAMLYDRIDRRVDAMIENGLLEEANEFLTRHTGKTAAQAIGIKELAPYFEGTQSLDACIDQLKMETRRYAKRQLTWFGRDERIHWLYADELCGEELVNQALKVIAKEV